MPSRTSHKTAGDPGASARLPRRVPRQDRAKQTVGAILRAASEVLAEEGYDSASTNKIARRAGVSIGALYEYFPNKEALVASLIERYASGVGEVMRARLEEVMDLPVRQAVSILLRTLVDRYRVNPALPRVLVEQIPGVGDKAKLQQIYDEIADLVREYLARHRAELVVTNGPHQLWVFTTAASQLGERIGLYCPEDLDVDALVEAGADMLTSWLLGT